VLETWATSGRRGSATSTVAASRTGLAGFINRVEAGAACT
jgi:hypothetical protein